jgi:hypothetical protein
MRKSLGKARSVLLGVALAAALIAGFAVNGKNDDAHHIPDITLTETIDGTQAKALRFGYSWYDGKDGVVVDSVAVWQCEYAAENTLVINGERSRDMIIDISAEEPSTASYVIYLPDGTVFDDGTRDALDSCGSLLYWTADNGGVGVMTAFGPGEYIYEVTIGWDRDDLKVTYGFKVVMTGIRDAYNDALGSVRDGRPCAYHGRASRGPPQPDREGRARKRCDGGQHIPEPYAVFRK